MLLYCVNNKHGLGVRRIIHSHLAREMQRSPCVELRTQFFQQEYAAQGILYGRVGRWCPRCDTHDNIFCHIQNKGFCDDFTIDVSMGNGVIGADAITAINVEGSNTSVNWDLQQVCRVRGIPSTNHEDKIQSQLGWILYQFMNRVLSFLMRRRAKSRQHWVDNSVVASSVIHKLNAYLSGITDRIEFHIMSGRIDWSILLHHSFL